MKKVQEYVHRYVYIFLRIAFYLIHLISEGLQNISIMWTKEKVTLLHKHRGASSVCLNLAFDEEEQLIIHIKHISFTKNCG